MARPILDAVVQQLTGEFGESRSILVGPVAVASSFLAIEVATVTSSTPIEFEEEAPLPSPSHGGPVLALVGNPNVGKTSLFNRLTHLLAKTSNFPGTTVEHRVGWVTESEPRIQLIDLPGIYSLDPQSPDEAAAVAVLRGELDAPARLDGIVVVVDATNLQRSLFVAGQVRELGLPMLLVVNMLELARRKHVQIDLQRLSERMECPVVGVSARTGENMESLRREIARLTKPAGALSVLEPEPCDSCGSCPYAEGHRWAATLARESVFAGKLVPDVVSDTLDRVVTHRAGGPLLFVAVMFLVFASVFWIAQYPMGWLETGFAGLAELLGAWLPEGDIRNLVTEGIVGGVGGVLVFLPQICILFFALAILEDSGYLARAVMVVDRWLRRVGLPGQAFVPLLAAHACAIPAIMATRVIEDRRDRLAAIMVIPLMTCSARLPVYSMIAAMLFPASPGKAAALFAGAYFLGIVAAFVVAGVLRVSLLPGTAAPLILDLPPYRLPSVGNAVRQALHRGWMFVRDAGTIILVISVIIWALSTYPKYSDDAFETRLASHPAALDLSQENLDVLRDQWAQENSVLGRAGKGVQPLFEPLGFDWKTSVGVLTSFAAREVVVSTLSVLYGLGEESTADRLTNRLRLAQRSDGRPVFDLPTCVALLVFFVLAMQCLPTQAVTRRETGSWKWALFQLVYMTCLAYVGAWTARCLTLVLLAWTAA